MLSYKIRRALNRLWDKYPDPIVDAAFDIITVDIASRKLRLPRPITMLKVKQCALEAYMILGDQAWAKKEWLCLWDNPHVQKSLLEIERSRSVYG